MTVTDHKCNTVNKVIYTAATLTMSGLYTSHSTKWVPFPLCNFQQVQTFFFLNPQRERHVNPPRKRIFAPQA